MRCAMCRRAGWLLAVKVRMDLLIRNDIFFDSLAKLFYFNLNRMVRLVVVINCKLCKCQSIVLNSFSDIYQFILSAPTTTFIVNFCFR